MSRPPAPSDTPGQPCPDGVFDAPAGVSAPPARRALPVLSGHPCPHGVPEVSAQVTGPASVSEDTREDTCPALPFPASGQCPDAPVRALEVPMPDHPTATVGRIVMYVSHGTPVRSDGSQQFPPKARAAIITEVDADDPGRVGLAVLNPTGSFFHPLIAGGSVYADPAGMVAGSWHWPERA